MKKLNFKTLLLLMVCWASGLHSAVAQEMKPEETEDWSRKPEMVQLEGKNQLPSDAIVLFSKNNLDQWHAEDGSAAKWKVKGSMFQVTPKTGLIITNNSFGDCQLHIEWNSPKEDVKAGLKSQGCGNSGIFLMGKYEVQVLNSYENETYYNGQASSIYKQHIPLVNASMKPGEWQSYDIIFTAPVFEGEGETAKLVSPAYATVLHNGVLVQNHVELKGPTEYIGIPKYTWHPAKQPISLQDHGNRVSYRNIWIRNL
ncbi:MAG: DUF1080 domain-containing protein [Prolixibacteraceae bacterium]